jgi:hypothetical protein
LAGASAFTDEDAEDGVTRFNVECGSTSDFDSVDGGTGTDEASDGLTADEA